MDDEDLKETIRRTIAEVLAESRPAPSAASACSCCPVTEIVIRVGNPQQVRTLSLMDICCHQPLCDPPDDICCHQPLSNETVELLHKAAAVSGTTVEQLLEETENGIRGELQKIIDGRS